MPVQLLPPLPLGYMSMWSYSWTQGQEPAAQDAAFASVQTRRQFGLKENYSVVQSRNLLYMEPRCVPEQNRNPCIEGIKMRLWGLNKRGEVVSLDPDTQPTPAALCSTVGITMGILPPWAKAASLAEVAFLFHECRLVGVYSKEHQFECGESSQAVGLILPTRVVVLESSSYSHRTWYYPRLLYALLQHAEEKVILLNLCEDHTTGFTNLQLSIKLETLKAEMLTYTRKGMRVPVELTRAELCIERALQEPKGSRTGRQAD